VNAPLVSQQNKNTNNAKSEVRFKLLIRDAFTIDSSAPTLRRSLNEHPILFHHLSDSFSDCFLVNSTQQVFECMNICIFLILKILQPVRIKQERVC
jgi:hypothetical protein